MFWVILKMYFVLGALVSLIFIFIDDDTIKIQGETKTQSFFAAFVVLLIIVFMWPLFLMGLFDKTRRE